jgi:cytochrome P450
MATALDQKVYRVDFDPFSDEFIRDPWPFHEQMRRAGPVAWIPSIEVWAVSSYSLVRQVLEDHATFCSSGGVGLSNFKKAKPWRTPSLLLETDQPEHTRNRAIISRALSPVAIRSLKERFDNEANLLVDRLVQAGTFDAVRDMAEPFPLKAFGDAVGVPSEGREQLLVYANALFNSFGPHNARCVESLQSVKPVADWVWAACQRDALEPGGLGRKIYEAADSGAVNEYEAAMIVRSFLSAGIDTTANALASALAKFAAHPDQWELVRAKPDLVRPAFEEVIRMESPFQILFRTTTRPTVLGGVQLDADQKIMLSLQAANRDPNHYQDPDRFDIRRSPAGHVGFGAGIHGCVGQIVARMESESLMRAFAARVTSFEVLPGAQRRLHNILRGYETLPVRVQS